MDKQFWIRVGKRFARAFVIGGMAQVVAMIGSGAFTAETWSDVGRWTAILAVAFVTGGLMALDKALRNTPEEKAEVK
jgi:hypothetical protein